MVADVETRRRERFVNSLRSCRLRARSKAARRTATERGRTWSARPRSYATRWSYIRTASRRRVIALGDARATPAVGAAKNDEEDASWRRVCTCTAVMNC